MSKKRILVAGVVVLVGGAMAAWQMTRPREVTVSEILSRKLPDGAELRSGETKLKIDDAGFKSIFGEQIKQFDELAALKDKPARDAFLDKLIDAQEKAIAEMPRDVQAMMKPPADGSPGSVKTEVNDDGKGNRQVRQMIRVNAGAADDGLPPEFKAKMAEFARQINQRRAERGLPPSRGMTMTFKVQERK